MSNDLVNELRNALKSFLAKATDQQFCELLAEADRGVYSKIDIPVAALHKNINYTAKPVTYSTFNGLIRVYPVHHPDTNIGEATSVLNDSILLSISPFPSMSLAVSGGLTRFAGSNEEPVSAVTELPVAA